MAKPKTEQDVKKAMGIDSFRNLSKDGVMQFVNLMNDLTPEVRLAIIEQFPNFKELALDVVDVYEEAQQEVAGAVRDSTQEVHNAWADVRRILEKELDSNIALTKEERLTYLQMIVDTAEKQGLIHANDQNFWDDYLLKAGQIVLGGMALGLVAVAGIALKPKN